MPDFWYLAGTVGVLALGLMALAVTDYRRIGTKDAVLWASGVVYVIAGFVRLAVLPLDALGAADASVYNGLVVDVVLGLLVGYLITHRQVRLG